LTTEVDLEIADVYRRAACWDWRAAKIQDPIQDTIYGQRPAVMIEILGILRSSLALLHTNRFVCSDSQHRDGAKRFKLHYEKESEQ
jgi:hypothetical protein